MDPERLQRLTEEYRQMPDDKLESLLARRESLTEEAERTLVAVIAERPDADNIRQRALAREQGGRQDHRAERPTLGFWLGFLTFGLCVAPLRFALGTYQEIYMAEKEVPQLLELGNWQIYKLISVGLGLAVLAAAVVAIHAIHAGRTHQHLLRIVAALWSMSLGASLIDYVSSGILFGFGATHEALSDQKVLVQLVISLTVTSLWTAYLLRSERCRLRYPRTPEESVQRVFD